MKKKDNYRRHFILYWYNWAPYSEMPRLTKRSHKLAKFYIKNLIDKIINKKHRLRNVKL
jgi:hypothetical protein